MSFLDNHQEFPTDPPRTWPSRYNAMLEALDNATLRPIQDGDSITEHRGGNQSLAAGAFQTIFDLSGEVDLLGGVAFSTNIGLRLTIDGTVVVNSSTASTFGQDEADSSYSVVSFPVAKSTTSMKLEVRNNSGSERIVGWRAHTR